VSVPRRGRVSHLAATTSGEWFALHFLWRIGNAPAQS